jgi:GST-like protein
MVEVQNNKSRLASAAQGIIQIAMIDLHYAPTPNGWKISIMLEELGSPIEVIPVNIRSREQIRPNFWRSARNNRIPAIVDHPPRTMRAPFSVFETGAIPDLPRREDRALLALGHARRSDVDLVG